MLFVTVLILHSFLLKQVKTIETALSNFVKGDCHHLKRGGCSIEAKITVIGGHNFRNLDN